MAYLPWKENPSKILFAQNLTEFTDNGDGQDVYNVLIPFGANKIKLNETTATQRDDYIERVQNDSEVDTDTLRKQSISRISMTLLCFMIMPL